MTIEKRHSADYIPATMRMRRRRRALETPALRITGLSCALLVSIFTVVLLLVLTGVYAALTRNLPSPESLAAFLEPPDGTLLQPTRLYDRGGNQVILTLAHPGSAGKVYLRFDETQAEQIPPQMIAATLTASDPNFWRHSGYQITGLRSGDHPTLAQRLVAALMLDSETPGLQQALRERLLAAQVTSRYGREKVVEWFLNSAYYGNLAYGVDAAARVYFGKPASTLNLTEAAILAAVAEAPALNPLDTPDEALNRGREILGRMLEAGAITTASFRQAMAEEPHFQVYPPAARNPHSLFTDLVVEQLAGLFGRTRVERGGLRVITSLDYDLQLQSDCTLQVQLARLNKPETEVPEADRTICPAAQLLPQTLSAEANQPLNLEGIIVILQPDTGEILALAGDPMPGIRSDQVPGRPAVCSPLLSISQRTPGG